MPCHSENRSKESFSRIGGGISVHIQRPPLGNRFALFIRSDDITAGHDGCGQIHLDVKALPCRKRNTDGVGAEIRLAASGWRHGGLDIGGCKQNHVLIGSPVAEIGQCTEVLGVGDSGRCHAVGPRQRNQQVQNFHRLHLSQPVSGVHRQNSIPPLIDFEFSPWIDQALLNPTRIDVCPGNAMGGCSVNIGFHE